MERGEGGGDYKGRRGGPTIPEINPPRHEAGGDETKFVLFSIFKPPSGRGDNERREGKRKEARSKEKIGQDRSRPVLCMSKQSVAPEPLTKLN